MSKAQIKFDYSLHISAIPARVISAFFDPAALAVWWQVTRSVTTPRTLGVYAVEWDRTGIEDEVLGPLGGVFHGMVVDYREEREFLLGNAYWVPPLGDPVGPMALEVSCESIAGGTRLTVLQTGFEDAARWRRYYGVIGQGWRTSLQALKTYLELGPSAVIRER